MEGILSTQASVIESVGQEIDEGPDLALQMASGRIDGKDMALREAVVRQEPHEVTPFYAGLCDERW